ncbi:MAG: hypothetical protein LUF32_03260 [Clostridiales bacterium]|nr:hypothetical protein [Clostridiales bacterium]
MQLLEDHLLQEELSLMELIAKLKKSLEEAPKGTLRISCSGKRVQYYYRPGKTKLRDSEQSKSEQNKTGQNKSGSGKSEQSKTGQNKSGLQKKEFHGNVIQDSDESGRNRSRSEAVTGKTHKLETCYTLYAIENMKSDHGVYIKKCDEKLAYDLAQRDYDAALLAVLERRLNYVQNLLEHCRKNETERIFDRLHPVRKEIVKPRIISDEEFAGKWSCVKYEGKVFSEGTAVMYTNRGERVRSKSEKIIADMLSQKNISYRYEAPVTLHGMGIVYPDFTILNVKRREEIYWEHLGMMDQKDYCERALRKIEIYQRNGIILGRKLIITYETSQHPLETQMVERNISEYCLKA